MGKMNSINWLDVANTYVNYKTLESVNQLSRAQQQVANQMLSIGRANQNDNEMLSHLVDILSQIRRLLIDNQYSETFILATTGVELYNKYYYKINNAEIKLKATEIQVNFLEVIKKSILDDSIRNSLQLSIEEFLNSFINSIMKSVEHIEKNKYDLVMLTPDEELKLKVDESLVCMENIHAENGDVLFRQGELYSITWIEDNTGFFLIDEFGKESYLFFGRNGYAENFAFFNPSFTFLSNNINAFELCKNAFTNKTILSDLKSVSGKLLDIYSSALNEVNTTNKKIDDLISKYRETIKNIITQAIKDRKIEKDKKADANLRLFVFIGITITISIIIFSFFAR